MTSLEQAGARATRVIAVLCVAGLALATALWWLARDDTRTVTGYFSSAVAVFPDNEVRILGVPVGTITAVQPQGPVVRVDMEIDRSVNVPADASAVVVAPSLVTGRNIELTPAYTGGPTMPDGAVIPLERTAVPLGVDDLARTANDLSTALGPRGVNRQGALSDALNVGADNLDGNGQALHDTIGDLSDLSGTLADSREDLFGTVTHLQSFVSTLAANDQQVREFNTRLADVSAFLASERGDLGAALEQLSVALGDVAVFVQDNRAVLKSNVDRLTEVTGVLVEQRAALADVFDTAPAGLSNLANAYNASSGTLDTRANLEELRAPPVLFVCQLLQRGTPRELPPSLADTCAKLEPQLSGAAPLPSVAEVISALQTGTPPPLPMLAVPTVPGPTVPGPTVPGPTVPGPTVPGPR